MAADANAPLSIAHILTRIGNPSARERFSAGYTLAVALYGARQTVVGLSCLEHGLRVADGLLDFNIDGDTLQAGLLNHAAGEAELQQVEAACGSEVVRILSALRRLDIYTEKAQEKASQRTLEAIRRAALTVIGGDVRVVLIRLMMALQTLRAAEQLTPEQRKLFAQDARNIYAPLANRLGIWQLKWELEDLAFRYLEPERYKAIVDQLNEKREDRARRIEAARRILQEKLREEGIAAEVTGRPKHIYSIHRKLMRKDVEVQELRNRIFDTQALRIILDQDEPERPDLSEEARKKAKYVQCYRALGIVHNIWRPKADEFDDYIQKPKPNGYRSLHTTVTDDDGGYLEIQIRTRQMHREAEQGLAAHWVYKEGGRPTAAMVKQVESLRYLLNAMHAPADRATLDAPVDDDDESADEAVLDRVYVFSPKGDVYDLPLGSTPVDFAYKIHSEVGHRCRGATVNGAIVPLTYQLRSGDKVQIIVTSRDKPGRPSRDWANRHTGYTRTGHARSRVRKWFRDNEREQNIEYGRAILERELKRLKAGNVTPEDLAALRGESPEDFLAKVGFGDLLTPQIEGMLAVIQRERKQIEPLPLPDGAPPPPRDARGPKGLTVLGVSGLATHLANCCNPIPPQPIVGYITRGRGVSVHRVDCSELIAREKAEPERIVEVDWGEASAETFAVPFHVKAYRAAGVLETIARILQGQNINLRKTKTVSSGHHTTFYIEAEVKRLEQAEWIKTKIGELKSVFDVQSR